MQVHPTKVSIRKPNQQQPMKMKPYQKIAALAAVFSLGLVGSIYAEDKHDHGDHDGHDHGKHAKKIAGPNGGRVLTGVEPHLEFFLTKDRKVKITAVDDDGKAVELGEQSVTVTGGSRSNPTRLTFTKDGNSLISDKAFPEGKMLPVIVQIKAKPDAKSVVERFVLNLSDCPGCKYLEYACTCDH
jgi:hypothetical protein